MLNIHKIQIVIIVIEDAAAHVAVLRLFFKQHFSRVLYGFAFVQLHVVYIVVNADHVDQFARVSQLKQP